MPTDQHGLELTAAGDDAVVAFDATIDSYLALGRDTGAKLKAVFGADPDMVMAHCLKGYFFHLMGSGALLPRAAAALELAKACSAAATPRERAHVAALESWCGDDPAGARAVWEGILRDHPRDVLAMRLSHHALFYEGDSAGMRDSVERALVDWDEAAPGWGFVLGMRSFAYEECGDYRTAEEVGRLAVETTPDNPWAIHAVAHVMEMEGRSAEGIEWIAGLEPHWTPANNFRYHLWWHRALMHLNRGETDEVLRLYDEDLWDPESDEYLDLCNDALLLRLELEGVDVGDRWRPLADKVRGRTDEHILTFIDTHFMMVLAGAGEWEAADAMLESMTRRGGNVGTEVGVPVCRAIMAHRRGDFHAVRKELVAVRPRIVELGGSYAQRNIFAKLLIDAVERTEAI